MNVVVLFVVAAMACLFGGTMADYKVAAVFTGSTSSKGSTGGLLGCKPRSASSPSGPKASLIRFQAVRTGGVEYSRVRVSSERMNFIDVTVMHFGSLNFPQCVKAANKNKMDAFSFENGQCVGYKIGAGICPCTKGDLVLYRATSAIRRTSSAKTLTVAKERAGAAPLPAGYVRKIIYPTVSMTGDNFWIWPSSCEDVLAFPIEGLYRPSLLHTVNGKCYFTVGFYNKFPCTSCLGTAMDVIVKEPPANHTYLLSNCGRTIMVPTYDERVFKLGSTTPWALYSHEGYGCIPYPDPVSDDNCDITLLGPSANSAIFVESFLTGDLDIDASTGTTCDGDELYVNFGSAQGSKCRTTHELFVIMSAFTDRVTIRFQRKPSYNEASVKRGFALLVYAYV